MEPEDSYTSYEVALTLHALNALVRRAHPGGADLMVLDIAWSSTQRILAKFQNSRPEPEWMLTFGTRLLE